MTADGAIQSSAAARRPSSASGCVPGTGEFKLNGRTLESYFPNKVHQQLIREPFVTLEKDGQYDVIASLTAAASPARPARCGWPSPARSSSSSPTTVRR